MVQVSRQECFEHDFAELSALASCCLTQLSSNSEGVQLDVRLSSEVALVEAGLELEAHDNQGSPVDWKSI